MGEIKQRIHFNEKNVEIILSALQYFTVEIVEKTIKTFDNLEMCTQQRVDTYEAMWRFLHIEE